MKKIILILSLSILLISCKNTRDYTIEELNYMNPQQASLMDKYRDIPLAKKERELLIKQRNEDIEFIEKYGSQEVKNSQEYKQLFHYWNGLIELTDKMIKYECVFILDPLKFDKYIEKIEFYKKEINKKYFDK